MLESKHYVVPWYSFHFYSPSSIRNLLGKCLIELIYLISPEETGERAGGRRNEDRSIEASDTRSIVKALFWVVMSISISLTIGQL